MLIIFKILLAMSSTSLFTVIYLIKSKYHVFNSIILSYTVYFLTVILLAYLALLCMNFLERSSLASQLSNKKNSLEEIELANHTFLPTYLGYFFIALSIPDKEWSIFVALYLIMFIFVYLSQNSYFNPIFIVFGYQFYYVKTSSDVKLFLISKKLMKNHKVYKFNNLRKINDFTFMDKGDLE
ncbi:hypothetical protein [Bacillus sp. FJAT-52991]|uniref:Uncharacterized protein n=1 Tax=Bacillus kandeliae TaxID=3129297 RepID=A0ABZ2NBP2_9BACI